MDKSTKNRRSFIKGVLAGAVGAFLSLRGAAPVEAAASQTPRRLRHVITTSFEASYPVILNEVRPKRGTVERCWVFVSEDTQYWVLMEVGCYPDGFGFVKYVLPSWEE